ncbi:MAG: hypothetical protein U7127_04660 [Phormidium sp.]
MDLQNLPEPNTARLSIFCLCRGEANGAENLVGFEPKVIARMLRPYPKPEQYCARTLLASDRQPHNKKTTHGKINFPGF